MGSLVMILDGLTSNSNDGKLVTCQLQHPRTRNEHLLLIHEEKKQCFELVRFEETFRSWISDDDIIKDGSLVMATEINLVYFVLPYLRKHSSRFMEFESLLEDEDFPDTKKLSCSNDCLATVTDVKIIDEVPFYKYSESKTLKWLEKKVLNVVAALRKNNVEVSSTESTAPCFDKLDKKDLVEADYLLPAFEMVSQYLEYDLSALLRSSLKLSEECNDEENAKEPPSKRIKLDDITPLEDYSKHNIQLSHKPEKLTPAQKKLKNVDKQGMKSISSFFGAPSKK